jgi:MFS transporter, FHS family, L-fucose permease
MAKQNQTALAAMAALFFLWGFVASANHVLIPACKTLFELSQTQSMTIDLAFYAAYGLGGLSYFLAGLAGKDLLRSIGHKGGLLLGLSIASAGALSFGLLFVYPESFLNQFSFPAMLGGLFIMGLGFSLLQIVANPYLIALGSELFAAQRVNLAGALNSLGTTLGPLVMGYAFFKLLGGTTVEGIATAYSLVGSFFLLITFLFLLLKLPELSMSGTENKGKSSLQFPQLLLGLPVLFIYVGTEVTISSNLPALLEQDNFLTKAPKFTVAYTALYWASLMMGRWMGAVAVLGISGIVLSVVRFLAPFLAFTLAMAFIAIESDGPLPQNWELYPALMVLILVVPYLIGQEKPARTLFILCLSGGFSLLTGLYITGPVGSLFIVASGLACSVLWSCIFSLAIRGLGNATHQGAGLLIVMILGGAVLPMLQGMLADTFGMSVSYVIPVVGFALMATYPLILRAVLKRQGLETGW